MNECPRVKKRRAQSKEKVKKSGWNGHRRSVKMKRSESERGRPMMEEFG